MRFGWAQVGDRLEERFTLFNDGSFPALWVELDDCSSIPDYRANLATGVGGASSYQWHTQGQCTRRGLFTLGPTTLRTSDPLGLYQVEIHDPHSVTLMVTPPIVPLPAIEVAPGGRAGQGRPRPNAPERTVSAAGVREYIHGDSLHWIHWRTTARRDDLYVRLFDSTPSGDWWIILDVDQSVQAGQGARSTEEHGVILAASLADRGLRMGKAVGLVAHGQPLVYLPPREGDGQRWEILRALAVLKTAPNPLAELLVGLRSTLGGFTSLVIITSNTRGDWLEGLLPLLWLGAVPTVLLLDPLSFSSPPSPDSAAYRNDGLNPGAAGITGIPLTTTGSLPSAQGLIEQLTRWGVRHHLITPDLLDRPEAQPGRRGQWEWRISPTGRAVAVNPSRDTTWRSIA